jgi:hypothetical protein
LVKALSLSEKFAIRHRERGNRERVHRIDAQKSRRPSMLEAAAK